MEEAFDPYEHWLGISQAEQPPDYYRLLGLQTCECNQELIARAHRLRMNHVQLCDDGTYPEAARRLREHLAGARQVLLDAQSKQQYDALLLGPQMAAPPGAAPAGGVISAADAPPPADPEPLFPAAAPIPAQGGPTAVFREEGPFGQAAQATVAPEPKRPSAAIRFWLSWIVSAALALAVAIPVLAFVARRDRARPAAPVAEAEANAGQADGRSESSGATTAGHAPEPARASDSGRPAAAASPPTRADRPRGPRSLADLMARDDDAPADGSTVTGLLQAARFAISGRDLDAAGDHVRAAVAMAQSPTERESARRIETLHRSVETFWQAVRDEAAKLTGGEELPVRESRVMIVEAGGGGLLVRVLGQNRRYEVGDLPASLAVALALKHLPPDDATTHLYVGSFLAVDARGDEDQAAEHLRQAGPEGQALLAELAL